MLKDKLERRVVYHAHPHFSFTLSTTNAPSVHAGVFLYGSLTIQHVRTSVRWCPIAGGNEQKRVSWIGLSA